MVALLTTTVDSLKITDNDFLQLRDFIYDQTGIYVAENRKYLLENRLANRLKALGLKTFGEYYYYLRFDAGKREELKRLFEVITTNETSFFRNPPQLKVFQDIILKQLIEDLRSKRQKKIRIWSAGCSSGEEPYTVSIILHELLKKEIASLAQNMRIPLDVEQAIDLALTGRLRTLDLARLKVDRNREVYFTGMAGIGFDAALMSDTDEKLKRIVGPAAYLVGFAKQLGIVPRRITVVVDDRLRIRRRAVLISVDRKSVV